MLRDLLDPVVVSVITTPGELMIRRLSVQVSTPSLQPAVRTARQGHAPVTVFVGCLFALLASACGGARGTGPSSAADVGIGTKRNPNFASGALPGPLVWAAPASCTKLAPDGNTDGLAPFAHPGHSKVNELLQANLCAEVARSNRETANDLDRNWHAGKNLSDAVGRFCFQQIKGCNGVVAAVRDSSGPSYTVVVFDKQGAVLYIDRKFQEGATPPNDAELKQMMDSVPAT